MLSKFTQRLKEHFSDELIIVNQIPVGGGDIHNSWVLHLSGSGEIPERVFVKFNSSNRADVLWTECESLQKMNELCEGLYPEPLMFDSFDHQAAVFMAFHDIVPISRVHASEAGRLLAKQHQVTNDQFGWSTDNYIGLTPQLNTFDSNWIDFFREQRLLPMFDRAKTQGLAEQNFSKIDQVIWQLDQLLCHEVCPSLLHGDLWAGNLGIDRDASKPIFFDPAPYFGDRETDLAMTELFGRLPSEFYQAYREVFPLEKGYEQRRSIYNLYHALNHVVLFGATYNSLVSSCLNNIRKKNNI